MSIKKVIFFLFCGAFFVMPMGTSPFTILGGCALLLWLFSGEFIRSRQGYIGKKWFFPVAAIVCLYWAGLIWSYDPDGLGFKFASKTYYWLFAFAITSISVKDYSTEYLFKSFLAGLFLNALVGFLQFVHIVPIISKFGTVYTGFYGGYNTLEILLVLGMMMASFYFNNATGKKEKILYALMTLCYFFHLSILTGRGGYITFFIMSPFIIYNLVPKKKKILTPIIFFVAVGLMCLSPVVQDRAVETVNAIKEHFNAKEAYVTGEQYYAPLDRIYMWHWAISLFKKHPFLGVGTGGYYKAILLSGGDMGIAHPHNNILYIAVSFGLLGLSIYAWFFWIMLKSAWKHKRNPVGFFVLSSTLVILVGGLVDTHILDAGGAFLLAVTTGLVSMLPKKNES